MIEVRRSARGRMRAIEVVVVFIGRRRFEKSLPFG